MKCTITVQCIHPLQRMSQTSASTLEAAGGAPSGLTRQQPEEMPLQTA